MVYSKTTIYFIIIVTFIASLSLAQGWYIGQSWQGDFTYYTDSGYGACGSQVDASTQELVAISWTQWAGGNPNNDPICNNVCLNVQFNGSR